MSDKGKNVERQNAEKLKSDAEKRIEKVRERTEKAETPSQRDRNTLDGLQKYIEVIKRRG